MTHVCRDRTKEHPGIRRSPHTLPKLVSCAIQLQATFRRHCPSNSLPSRYTNGALLSARSNFAMEPPNVWQRSFELLRLRVLHKA